MKRNQRAQLERAEHDRICRLTDQIVDQLKALDQVPLKAFESPGEAADFAYHVRAIEEIWMAKGPEEEEILRVIGKLPDLFPCYARYLRMEAISRDIARREKRAATAHRFERLDARLSTESMLALEFARLNAPKE